MLRPPWRAGSVESVRVITEREIGGDLIGTGPYVPADVPGRPGHRGWPGRLARAPRAGARCGCRRALRPRSTGGPARSSIAVRAGPGRSRLLPRRARPSIWTAAAAASPGPPAPRPALIWPPEPGVAPRLVWGPDRRDRRVDQLAGEAEGLPRRGATPLPEEVPAACRAWHRVVLQQEIGDATSETSDFRRLHPVVDPAHMSWDLRGARSHAPGSKSVPSVESSEYWSLISTHLTPERPDIRCRMRHLRSRSAIVVARASRKMTVTYRLYRAERR